MSKMSYTLKTFVFSSIIVGLVCADVYNLRVGLCKDEEEDCGIGSETNENFVKIGNKYFLIKSNTEVNWFIAQKLCRQLDASLASFGSEAEFKMLTDYLSNRKNDKPLWIAYNNLASQEELHSITTGEKAIFFNGDLKNANQSSGKNCVQLTDDFFMHNIDCLTTIGYICEISLPQTISFSFS